MHDSSWPADALAAVVHPDPYPYYSAIAQAPGLVRDERLGLWIATHPVTVREVMAHPACRVRPAHEPVPATIAGGPAGELFGALVRMNDGERHAVPKAALQQALAQVTEIEVAAHTRSVAARLPVQDADSLNAFVSGVPVQTVASLLGFDARQLPLVARAVGEYVACLSPLSAPAQSNAAHPAANMLLEAMRALARIPPPDGLLARVLAAGWRDEHAMLSNLVGLLTQTCEATAGLLGNCIVARLHGATGTPAALAAGVSERDPAIHNSRRFAAHEVEIGGVKVGAGDAILLILANGQPFGHGRHACPGTMLAQAIAAQALAALDDVPQVGWRYRPSLNARIPFFLDKEQA